MKILWCPGCRCYASFATHDVPDPEHYSCEACWHKVSFAEAEAECAEAEREEEEMDGERAAEMRMEHDFAFHGYDQIPF